jgi:hypothetical protein
MQTKGGIGVPKGISETRKTLIAVLASHDSVGKNNELARIIEELYDKDKGKLGEFHFLCTGGTFNRLVLGKDTADPPRPEIESNRIRADVRDFIESLITVLPDRREGGIAILGNLIVQRQCSIIWPFLSPITVHWLNPENLAMMRLCDLWNAKRLMNAESVRQWFREEAERDFQRNPQRIPLRFTLGTPESDNPWPEAKREAYENLQSLPQGLKFPVHLRIG